MRFPSLLLAAAFVLAPSSIAQTPATGEPVDAWYAITSGDQTEVVRAKTVEVRMSRGRAAVRAGTHRLSFDGTVRVAFLDLANPDDPRQRPPGPQAEKEPVHSTSTVVNVIQGDAGVQVHHATSIIKKNDDGSTTMTTTNTNTTANDDGSGSSTTTTETTTSTEPAESDDE